MCTEPLKVQLCCSKTTICKTIASCKSNFTATRSCLDPVLSSIRARNAQGLTITNCDVTTWSRVNLVNPAYPPFNLSLSNPVYVFCHCTFLSGFFFSSILSTLSLSLLLLNHPLSSLSLLFSIFFKETGLCNSKGHKRIATYKQTNLGPCTKTKNTTQ